MRSGYVVTMCTTFVLLGVVHGATDVQKRAAIDKGLEYLAQTQQTPLRTLLSRTMPATRSVISWNSTREPVLTLNL